MLTSGREGADVRTAISIVAVWRPTVTRRRRRPGYRHPRAASTNTTTPSRLTLHLQLTFALLLQDKHLPARHRGPRPDRAGLEAQRGVVPHCADRSNADSQLVLARRGGKGGAGSVQLRGTRPFKRLQDGLRHRHGSSGPGSPTGPMGPTRRRRRRPGDTPPLCADARFGEAVCDQVLDESAGAARHDVCEAAGERTWCAGPPCSTSCMKRGRRPAGGDPCPGRGGTAGPRAAARPDRRSGGAAGAGGAGRGEGQGRSRRPAARRSGCSPRWCGGPDGVTCWSTARRRG